ncbi:MAG: hypothetical protein H7Z17_13755 [Fuerstia sp.]|nr:hypothetical protein [Fuerstiella sp.]
MLSDNPYAPPQASTLHKSPAASRSHGNRMLLMLPFSIVAAIAGGALHRNPGILLINLMMHPMAPSGLVFGLCAALAGGLIFSTRRIWITPLIPFAAMAAFHITAHLMSLADLRLRNGGSAAVFVAELSCDSLVGMALIAVTFVLARMLTIFGALRWTVMGTFLGALCVVVVNGLSMVVSLSSLLYWTMFCWQFLMMQYLAWLSTKSGVATHV